VSEPRRPADSGRAPAERTAVSAGGVVFRRAPHGVEIVLVARPSEGLWALPKGTPEPGESITETALREVREETGLQVRIGERLGTVRYQFTDRGGAVIDKTVHHYLFEPVGGDLGAHDGEHEVVQWLDIHEAERLLTHRNQLHILDRAAECIEKHVT
jgi:8-oxo-dGTP pyrophosphatase MutT (NUDIX family)